MGESVEQTSDTLYRCSPCDKCAPSNLEEIMYHFWGTVPRYLRSMIKTDKINVIGSKYWIIGQPWKENVCSCLVTMVTFQNTSLCSILMEHSLKIRILDALWLVLRHFWRLLIRNNLMYLYFDWVYFITFIINVGHGNYKRYWTSVSGSVCVVCLIFPAFVGGLLLSHLKSFTV